MADHKNLMAGNGNDAYAEAMLGCFEALYRTAFRLIGNKSQAEDLVQETYLRAWRSLTQLHSLSGVRPWMFRILRTTFVDQLPRESNMPKLVIDIEKMLAAVDKLSPLQIFNIRERSKIDHLDELFDQP